MKYTIFSIDGQFNDAIRRTFEKRFREDPRTVGNLVKLVGCYKKTREHSYICYTADFNSFVMPMGYVVNQECILTVSECNKKYTVLHYIHDRSSEYLGCMKSVSEADALKQGNWSYRPDLGQYFITVKKNNDSYPEISSGVSAEEVSRIHGERCEARRLVNQIQDN